jgi:hypothetical protein
VGLTLQPQQIVAVQTNAAGALKVFPNRGFATELTIRPLSELSLLVRWGGMLVWEGG